MSILKQSAKEITVKPRFSVPAFSEFPYFVNILSGPGQSPI
jgi:hypothetical protein